MYGGANPCHLADSRLPRRLRAYSTVSSLRARNMAGALGTQNYTVYSKGGWLRGI